jgi:hypothetical protein
MVFDSEAFKILHMHLCAERCSAHFLSIPTDSNRRAVGDDLPDGPERKILIRTKSGGETPPLQKIIYKGADRTAVWVYSNYHASLQKFLFLGTFSFFLRLYTQSR